MSCETPYEIHKRLREQQDYLRKQEDARANAERDRLARASTYVAPKDLSDIHDPGERQKFLAQRKVDDDARAAAQAEVLTKDRIRRAFLSAGGLESDFEEQYPGLRKRYVHAQTLKALQDDDIPAVGSVTDDGMIRW